MDGTGQSSRAEREREEEKKKSADQGVVEGESGERHPIKKTLLQDLQIWEVVFSAGRRRTRRKGTKKREERKKRGI